jgi:hypothetical protein
MESEFRFFVTGYDLENGLSNRNDEPNNIFVI